MRVLPLILLMLIASLPAEARTLLVGPGESIQKAVDAAAPGDTVLVQPGTYGGDGGEALVHVRTSGVELRATRSTVLDARGYRHGILVGEGGPLPPRDGCPPVTVRGFAISGFTIQAAAQSGLHLQGVDGFKLLDGVYLDNAGTGASSLCSSHGVISGSYAAGNGAAAIHVGSSSHVTIEKSAITSSAIGVEIENSSYAIVRRNQLFGNSAGLLVAVVPGRPVPVTDHVRIEENSVIENNLSSTGTTGVGAIPTGAGILNAGGDHVSIERNVVLGNDSYGLAAIASPTARSDPRSEPFVDRQRVKRNVILLNGQNPDPLRATTPGADIVFVPDRVDFASVTVIELDPDPSDNCYGDNRSFTDFPADVAASLACP